MKRKLLFSGPVCTASGYGVHARQLLSAIVATNRYDVAVEAIRWGETPTLTEPEFDWIRLLTERHHAEPEVSIQVTIPNEFKRRAPLSIGVTAGIEVDRVSPHWLVKCNEEVDLVIVPSEHSRASFMVEYQAEDGSKLHLEKPIFVIPEGVDTSIYRPGVRSFKGDFAPRNFVFTGLGLDKANGRDRKNVSRLIEFFCKTFAGNPAVGLILKTSIVNYSTLDFETTKKRIADIKRAVGCGEFPRISLLHGRLSEADMADLYGDPRVIAAVSLTHGEGFGLPLIEAAACGLPVMATDWSGHLDFLTKDGRKLFVALDYDMEQIPAESVWEGVMDAGTQWATVREEDVRTKLQKMALSSSTPRKWAEELAEHIRARYSLEATGRAFTDLVGKAVDELERMITSPQEGLTQRKRLIREKGPSLVYTMPMSAGDVFLSTGVVSALRNKHPQHRIYFATSPQYRHILNGISIIDEVIDWEDWMLDPELLQDMFDEVYTPNIPVQLARSNWIHRGKGRNLIDEFAAQCNVRANLPIIPESPCKAPAALGVDKWIAVHSGGQKSARRYSHWVDLVKNIRSSGIKVMQVGARDDVSVGAVDLDARGGDHASLVAHLSGVPLILCIDSYPMHVAAALGLHVVALFGSSYPGSTGPIGITPRLKLLETPDRKGCERACYKDQCKVDHDDPCINNIDPERAFDRVLAVMGISSHPYKAYNPKIGGYTHILNPLTHGYPFVQSIVSMLGFCDEVVVVDGGSTDGSLKFLDDRLSEIHAEGNGFVSDPRERLRIITREWDPDEPGMDGMQKAFGRAMVSPDMEFLWQQDADEIVHEQDYEKILALCKRFPEGVDLIHLPVVELWGDDRHARTDRHSWKWRLSRNNLRITHGINIRARVIDQRTGRVYAKRGASDGCEMIDIVTGEHLPHRGFYSKELDALRQSDPAEYGRNMNIVFSKLPSVWHYSWADLPRKVRNFRDFWDKQWQVLYQSEPQPRFPNVVTEEDVINESERLLSQGGEYGRAPTFELTCPPPAIMKDRK